MRGKVWLLAGIVAIFGFGAAEAQAGTVFKACAKRPLDTFIGECVNVFMADDGQENDVVFSRCMRTEPAPSCSPSRGR